MRIREAAAADRDAILALRMRCFGEVDREKNDQRFWEWEFRDARCFVGQEENALTTHLAFVRTPYVVDGAIVEGGMAVDAMTAPEARGKGAFTQVVQASRDAFPLSTAYQIRRPVLGAMLRGGWSIAAKAWVLVRPLILAPRASDRVRLLTRDETPLMARIAASMPGARVARTPEWLAWRFFDNPHWSYRVTALDDRAYLVARRTSLKDFDTFAIADLAFTDRDAARELIRDAVAEGKRLGCTLAAALASPSHPAFWLLVRRGFIPSHHRFRLLVHPQRKLTWRVMWADTDHL